jgi:hypothetical protein
VAHEMILCIFTAPVIRLAILCKAFLFIFLWHFSRLFAPE